MHSRHAQHFVTVHISTGMLTRDLELSISLFLHRRTAHCEKRKVASAMLNSGLRLSDPSCMSKPQGALFDNIG